VRFSVSCSNSRSAAFRAELIRNALAPLSLRVRAVLVFGSIAKKTEWTASDIDLLVAIWRVLAKGHEKRNLSGYEGLYEMDDRLVTDVIEASRSVLSTLKALGPLHGGGPA